MKKLLLTVICLVLTFFIAGCEKDVNDEKVTTNAILGNWSISHAKNAVTGENISLQQFYGAGVKYGGVLTFYENNTFERYIGITSDDGATNGTYSMEGDVITLKYDSGTEATSVYLSSSDTIEYHLKSLEQFPVCEYYTRSCAE